MDETAIRLTLDRAQRAQLFAHLVVYLSSLTLSPLAPRHEASFEEIHEVAYRLHRFCLDESEEAAFWLSSQEAQLVQEVLIQLKPIYGQWPESPETPLALEHLSACLLLLQKAT